ncbi:MAG: carbohydrate binding family 9 domain-containing protein [Ignavibacteriae bacterium]|nr:carbohydrate binding family 9 domain-containing protein [Ignavibacteriota bacterium]MCB9259784.1 carbohydrate binding family 9 domain-containing protein [Ignavibacteriales bacterium]
MKKLIFYIFILCSTLIFSKTVNSTKVLLLNKLNTSIKIDGIIDDAWIKADSVSDFVQFQPYNAQIPTQKTIAKVITTENSLFCLMVCYDKKENIQNFTGKLDEYSGDVVSFMIDTFGDSRTAYKFAVSAGGVRSDCRLLDDARNRDYNWDGIWFAQSKIYDWGFVAEMEIPYKSIQYDKTISEWGLDFDRWRPIISEDIYWCAYEENEGQRISKFGSLILNDFRPTVSGLNLEIYPVGIAKTTYLKSEKYKTNFDAGVDIFYNPSEALTFQFTANPDFAQIEADPFNFNISRYESYFNEKRPFFTEGNEVFSPSGKQRNTGFYRPLELFYSRRIGKLLPDGTEVPLQIGTRAFGRMNDYEYGGFFAMTGETKYKDDDENLIEKKAVFGSARIKKQILENSSIGLLFVGKHHQDEDNGVLDVDGAFRGGNWQLAYQVARSFKNDEGDFAASAGYTQFMDNWIHLFRSRYIGNKFDIDQIGYVPWKGTSNTVLLTGPRWQYDEGYTRAILLYFGGYLGWEKADNYSDYGAILGYNMNFRNNWGFEINLDAGNSKDESIYYSSYSANLSSWFNISPKWNGNVWGGYQHSYNFSREYLAFYSWGGFEINWNVLNYLSLGTSYDMFIEGNPDNDIEDITYNARPYFSLTPINDLSIKMYADNVFVKSSDKLEQVILGFLFAYNFSPKSWIYFAINEVRDRSDRYDDNNNLQPRTMHVKNRAGVFKLKYLYYF